MNTTTSPTVVYLNFVSRELNRYIPLTFLVLGSIGNVLNLLVFSRPKLRNNCCSLYFISSSVVNFISLYVGLITPFLALYGLDPTQKWLIICQLRFYFRLTTITLSTWFILFTCVDRFLSTSQNVQLRSWSSMRLAKRTVLLSSVVCVLLPYPQVFICYTINQRNICALSNNLCKATVDATALAFNSGLPPILMVLFSVLTIQNVKRVHRFHSQQQRRDIQLIKLVLIQVVILVLLATPITAQKVYSSILTSITKNPFDTAVDSLLAQIAIEISYISNSVAFYIYSLTSKTFRREVRGIFCAWLPCLGQRRNRVQPNSIVFRLNRNLTTERHGSTHSKQTLNRTTKTWWLNSSMKTVYHCISFIVKYCFVKIGEK